MLGELVEEDLLLPQAAERSYVLFSGGFDGVGGGR